MAAMILLLFCAAPPLVRSVDANGDPLPEGAILRLGVVRQAKVTRFAHRGAVGAVTFSPDSRMLATGCEGGCVMIWDAVTGRSLRDFPGHGRITALTFSSEGRTLFVGEKTREEGKPARVTAWDIRTGKRAQSWAAANVAVVSLGVVDGGRLLVTCGRADPVRCWDAVSGKKVGELLLPGSPRLAGAARGCEALLSHEDGSFTAITCMAGMRAKLLVKGDESGHDLARMLPGGGLVIASSTVAKRYDCAGKLREKTLLPLPVTSIASVASGESPAWPEVAALSPDGEMLAEDWNPALSSKLPPRIGLRSTRDGHTLAVIEGHRGSLNALAFSPDAGLLASGGGDSTILVWDIETVILVRGLPQYLVGEVSRERLIQRPREATTRLERALAAQMESERVAGPWLAALDDELFEQREEATRQLEKIGARAVLSLNSLLLAAPSLEVRSRVMKLLGRLPEGEKAKAGEAIHTGRAVALLRLLQCAEAAALLRRIERLPAGSPLGDAARAKGSTS